MRHFINSVSTKLVRWILSYARGRHELPLESIGGWETLTYLWRRGGWATIRGFFWRLQVKSEGMIFVGKGVKIITPSKLKLGRKVFIGDYCHLNCFSRGGVTLESGVTIREFGWMQLTSRISNPGESILIKQGTYIGPRVILGAAAPLVIGERCQIGANVSFVAEQHEFRGEGEISEKGVCRSGITIGNDCWIGNNAVILDGVVIGNSAVIGAGAVVTRNVPDNAIAVGVPARIVGGREGTL